MIELHNMAYKDAIAVRVQAVNERGMSLISAENAEKPLIQDVPRKMDSCVQLDATSNKVVAFAWTVPDNGGSEVLDYLIFAKINDEQEYWQLDSDFNAL